MSQKYKMKYSFEFGEFTKEDIKKCEEDFKGIGGYGATDAFVLISLIRDEGAVSSLVLSGDGDKNGALLEDREIFKAWFLMAASLYDNGDLPEKFRGILKDSIDKVREIMNE